MCDEIGFGMVLMFARNVGQINLDREPFMMCSVNWSSNCGPLRRRRFSPSAAGVSRVWMVTCIKRWAVQADDLLKLKTAKA